MNYAAIIAEFNPLSNGHKYIIDETKKLFPNHKILVVMSGDFVQRGEPAILDKQTRAKHAICAGADVVIELPFSYATSSAEDFAYGAIKILNSINGVSHLVFGSECGDITQLFKAEQNLSSLDNKNIKSNLKNGNSFASSVINASTDQILTKPNNMLGVMYLKALKETNSNIIPTTIKRLDNYNSNDISPLASATAIRKSIKNKTILKNKNILPEFTVEDILSAPEISLDEYYKLLSYNLINTNSKELENIYGVSEGLEYKIISASITSTTFDEFICALTSKRYPKNKIKRILVHGLLNLTKHDMEKIKKSTPYLKVLAINDVFKKDILKDLSESVATLITKKKDYEKLDFAQRLSIELDIKVSNIYSILINKTLNSDFKLKI